jgi:DNA-binding MarR family transcriptional regulator
VNVLCIETSRHLVLVHGLLHDGDRAYHAIANDGKRGPPIQNARRQSGRSLRFNERRKEDAGKRTAEQRSIADASYYKQVGNAEITPRQFGILLSLQKSGHMTQAALSLVTRMDRSTINEMVPRMIERGLISKSNSPDDKRAIHLSITAHGLKTLNELLPATTLSQEMILATLPKEYRRIFKHCLEMIIEANEADLSK